MVDDIKKLRPALLDMSEAELERQMTEIEMALAHKRAAVEIAKRNELVAEATTRIERMQDDIRWLHGADMLPERLRTALTRSDGVFAPTTLLRVPKPEDVLTMKVPGAAKPAAVRERGKPASGKRRRRRGPNGEWLPSKAAQAAGEA